MSITFGSVGDIIAVGQIAWSLAKALTDSRGSAKEYQGLAKELQTFDRALFQVVALWQNYEVSSELKQLGTITKEAVNDWEVTLLAFRRKVDKYGLSLSAAGSGNWLKDASKKVVWLKEKEDILDLRRKLQSASDTIMMLTLAAMGKSNRLAEATQSWRVQAVHCMLLESNKRAEEQVTKLKIIDKKIEMQSKTSDLILSTMKSGTSYLAQITIDIKNELGLLNSHMSSQQSTPRGLRTGWQQDPVTLEDALGHRIPIPLELVNSWEMLYVILLKRFEKLPGHQKVLKGEYAIEEGVTGRDFSREIEWSICFRPGQKIDMSMVFSDHDATSNCCPRCGTESAASLKTRTQCANTACKMWFQRVVEIDKSEAKVVPSPRERPSAVEDVARIKRVSDPVFTPADFQRVRLMSNIKLKERNEEKKQENAHKGRHLEGKTLQYEQLREQKRRLEVEMQYLELQQRKEEQELAQMQGDLGGANSSNATTSHQSEPTTPLEYREANSGCLSAFSRLANQEEEGPKGEEFESLGAEKSGKRQVKQQTSATPASQQSSKANLKEKDWKYSQATYIGGGFGRSHIDSESDDIDPMRGSH